MYPHLLIASSTIASKYWMNSGNSVGGNICGLKSAKNLPVGQVQQSRGRSWSLSSAQCIIQFRMLVDDVLKRPLSCAKSRSYTSETVRKITSRSRTVLTKASLNGLGLGELSWLFAPGFCHDRSHVLTWQLRRRNVSNGDIHSMKNSSCRRYPQAWRYSSRNSIICEISSEVSSGSPTWNHSFHGPTRGRTDQK